MFDLKQSYLKYGSAMTKLARDEVAGTDLLADGDVRAKGSHKHNRFARRYNKLGIHWYWYRGWWTPRPTYVGWLASKAGLK